MTMALAPAGRVVDASVLALVCRLTAPAVPATLAEILEHRISTAIAIGLLQAGDRLPSEEIMAQVLGVSGLTFRQSLDRLRVRHLVTTRPGRGGGTVISPQPSDLEALAGSALTSTSTSDIADLGATFSALFSQAAMLAALRHDRFDDERLRHDLQFLTDAGDAIGRRRAATLFVVTVASAARSETLMGFLVPVVGDIQSILWLDDSESLLGEVVGDATQMLRAIAGSDPDTAERLARAHVDRLTSHLVTQRARQYTQAGRTTEGGLDALIYQMDGIRSALNRVGDELCHLSPPRPVRAGSAEVIDRLLCDVVDGHANLVRGAGIAYAPGMLPDAPLWMDWWDSKESERLAFKSHVFSNASLQYYDYTRMPWFTEPLRTGTFGAQGPYLDRGGIERVTITVSLPVAAPAFRGSVLGADLRLARIGEVFFAGADLQADDLQVLMLDEHQRVVVSAVPGVMPGDMIAPGRTREVTRIDPNKWPGLAGLGWRTARVA